MSIFKKKSLEDIKQPQEYYCFNVECTNIIAELDQWEKILSQYGKSKANHYCLDCIMERKVEC